MNSRPGFCRNTIVGAAGVLCLTFALCAQSPSGATDSPVGEKPVITAGESDAAHRVSVAVARDRARLMHDMYASTLDMLHHRYFHKDRSIIPARALEDVFSDMSRQSKVKARWISVNTAPMSIDHEPQSPFEKQAATAIASGKEEFELVEKGYYQRAAAIPLKAGCVGCHTGFFNSPGKSPRYAGLVISLPVTEE